MATSVAAIDLGASSGRVMLATVGRDLLELHPVARFANDPVRLPDGLHWNVVELYRQAVAGLCAAVRATGADGLAGAAVDSWAVDYGLLRGDRLLATPFHYRDERRGDDGSAAVHQVVSRAELFERNGLQFLPFNTVYQLAADPLVPLADHALLVPDLLGFWLTGRRVTERTNASTTGLLDVRTQDWDRELAAALGLPDGLFPELVDPGTEIGPLLPEVASLVGASALTLSTVGSHDTASAVVGVPMTAGDCAYISCGTWGLVGVEVAEPIVTAAAAEANFTNEGGVDGRTRFLTNVMGTWLLSEAIRTWEREDGDPVDLAQLLAQAGDVAGPWPVFDVKDARFTPPGDMPARVDAWCAEHDVAAPQGRPALVRSIVESLAAGFAHAVEQAAELSKQPVRSVHLVGGGAQNSLLCQAVADRSGRRVVAGPVEATALGNVLVQARTAGALRGDLDVLRALIRTTQALTTYQPRAGQASLTTP